jgi:hypothetical protein
MVATPRAGYPIHRAARPFLSKAERAAQLHSSGCNPDIHGRCQGASSSISGVTPPRTANGPTDGGCGLACRLLAGEHSTAVAPVRCRPRLETAPATSFDLSRPSRPARPARPAMGARAALSLLNTPSPPHPPRLGEQLHSDWDGRGSRLAPQPLLHDLQRAHHVAPEIGLADGGVAVRTGEPDCIDVARRE